MIKQIRNGIAVFLLLAGVAGAEEINPVVGRMKDFVLREADLERIVGYQSPEAAQKLESGPAQRAEVARQLLITKAIAARARKDGFDKKPEIKEQLSYLLDNYLAEQYLRKVVVVDMPVGDEELKNYYDEHIKDFLVPQRARTRHIFFEASGDAQATVKEKAKSKAAGTLAKLKAGADFAEVARTTSEDSDTASKGGDLGFLSPGKTNSKEFEEAVFALKAGETSPVVETPFGYHIIRVDERTEQRTARFDEAKEYIRSTLKRQREQRISREFIEKLASEAGVDIVMPPVPGGEKNSGK